MVKKMYAYCLFCDIRRCKNIAAYLKKQGFEEAFSPQIVKHERKNGKNEKVVYDLLPGYVFVFSSEPFTDKESILSQNGVIRILSSSEMGYLEGDDYRFAQKLFECKGIIDVVHMIKVGDTVSIKNDIFRECNGKVIKIDYRKQRAKVEFTLAGMTLFTWVAYEDISHS